MRSGNKINIDIEYARWVDVYKPINNKINKMRFNFRQKYEMKNNLERFFMRMANECVSGEVYLSLSMDHDIYSNLAREIKEKRLMGNNQCKAFLQYIQMIIAHHLKNLDTSVYKTHEIVKRGNLYSYGNFRYQLNEKRAECYKLNCDEEVMKMILRYSLMFLGGQQWNLPHVWYEEVVNKFDVSIEGFASPLNSQLMLFQKSPQFCSMFKDTDKPFGSLGNIFSLRPHFIENKVMMNNPPYVLEIMNKLVKIQEKWLSSVPTRIIMCVAAWEDANYFQQALKSRYLKYQERMEPGKHYYERTRQGKSEKIISRFPSHIFVFSSHEKEIPKIVKKYPTIADGWKIED